MNISQLDFSPYGVIELAIAIAVAIIASAFTGYFSETRWRNKAKKDLEMYALLERSAKTDEDRIAMELLRRSAVKTIIRGTTSNLDNYEVGKPFTVAIYSCTALLMALCGLSMVAVVYQAIVLKTLAITWHAAIALFVMLVVSIALLVYFIKKIMACLSRNRDDGMPED